MHTINRYELLKVFDGLTADLLKHLDQIDDNNMLTAAALVKKYAYTLRLYMVTAPPASIMENFEAQPYSERSDRHE